MANKQYSQCNHDYEITFDTKSQIEELPDDNTISQDVVFNFIDLAQLKVECWKN